jgi:hypothetical protein
MPSLLFINVYYTRYISYNLDKSLISIYMVMKQYKERTVRKDTTITADYILNLYKQSKGILNQKEQKIFVHDVKKLIPYIGQRVLLEIED